MFFINPVNDAINYSVMMNSLTTDVAFHHKWFFRFGLFLLSAHVSYCRATINKMMAGRKSEKGLLIVA